MRAIVLISLFVLSCACVTSASPVRYTLQSGVGETFVPAQDHLAVMPADRLSEPLWVELNDRIQAEIAAAPCAPILLLGDSITQGWRKHQDLWDQHFPGLKHVNAGIWADGTQHLLWRLKNHKVAGMSPKLITLLIGTNNGTNTAREIAEGISANITEIRKIFPHSRILLLGIFPSGKDAKGKRRQRNLEVNAMIARIADGAKIFYLDIGTAFLGKDSEISSEIMPDALHLTRKGYKLWAEAMAPAVQELLDLPAQAAGH